MVYVAQWQSKVEEMPHFALIATNDSESQWEGHFTLEVRLLKNVGSFLPLLPRNATAQWEG